MPRHRAPSPVTVGEPMPPPAAPGEPDYLIALLIAAPLLAVDGACAFIIARITAWYARRWRDPSG
jgi:hypothetical protein